MTGIQISNVSGVKKIKDYCRKLLDTRGVEVGNTVELPVNGHFVIPINDVSIIADKLLPLIETDIIDREFNEYREMLHAVELVSTSEFIRDINSRRAVTLHPGCITYQHVYLRNRELNYTVHMRSMDIRKFYSDFRFFLNAILQVRNMSLPIGTELSQANIHWTVDCFHKYTEEVPF